MVAALYFIRPLIGPLVISALLAFVTHPAGGRARLPRENEARHCRAGRVPAVPRAADRHPARSLPPLPSRQVMNLSFDLIEIEKQVEEFLSRTVSIGGMTLSMPAIIPQDFNQFLQDFVLQALQRRVRPPRRTDLQPGLASRHPGRHLLLPQGQRPPPGLAGRARASGVPGRRAQILSELNKIWGAFLRGQLILVLLITVSTSIFMSAVGLRGAIGVGILAGILDIILLARAAGGGRHRRAGGADLRLVLPEYIQPSFRRHRGRHVPRHPAGREHLVASADHGTDPAHPPRAGLRRRHRRAGALGHPRRTGHHPAHGEPRRPRALHPGKTARRTALAGGHHPADGKAGDAETHHPQKKTSPPK
ncbi:MAG: hypothetical protein MZV64_60045 [Ignavibacteriales bacterium]|nr:hypothetical protein [Ignavibacteriales bacterium]